MIDTYLKLSFHYILLINYNIVTFMSSSANQPDRNHIVTQLIKIFISSKTIALRPTESPSTLKAIFWEREDSQDATS